MIRLSSANTYIPAIDGLPVIIDTICVGVVKLVHAQSRSARCAAAGFDFKLSVLVLLLSKVGTLLTHTLYSPPGLVVSL